MASSVRLAQTPATGEPRQNDFSVLEALNGIDGDRACIIVVQNLTDQQLAWAGNFASSGGVATFDAVIAPRGSGTVVAEKTEGTLRGAEGVFHYKIGRQDKWIGIYYCVPWDRNLFENMFNVSIWENHEPHLDSNHLHVSADGAYKATEAHDNNGISPRAGYIQGEADAGYNYYMVMGTAGKCVLDFCLEDEGH